MQLTVDDAIAIITEYLNRRYGGSADGIANYGYDFSLTHFLARFAVERMGIPNTGYVAEDPQVKQVSPIFFDALWTLCRRGVLRPSVFQRGGQGLPNGEGYSVTNAGRAWLSNKERVLVPSDPSRFGSIAEKYAARFGKGFSQRAHEAIKCHEYGAYLAACAMAGAAAESILIELASAKSGDREGTLRVYLSRSGRRDTVNQVLAGVKEPLASQLRILMELLSHWRDSAAHGVEHIYTEVEAYDALSRLLRLTLRVGETWDELTAKQPAKA